jgi:hypothetical protein
MRRAPDAARQKLSIWPGIEPGKMRRTDKRREVDGKRKLTRSAALCCRPVASTPLRLAMFPPLSPFRRPDCITRRQSTQVSGSGQNNRSARISPAVAPMRQAPAVRRKHWVPVLQSSRNRRPAADRGDRYKTELGRVSRGLIDHRAIRMRRHATAIRWFLCGLGIGIPALDGVAKPLS